ncbi:Ion transport protein-domain-containing protein [Zopfochytrium polystomum]|nr:Ion transport protein-domain-containing protein [Zopfochytrium polystomum]
MADSSAVRGDDETGVSTFPTDGTSRAERRFVARPGVDVLLASPLFAHPGVSIPLTASSSSQLQPNPTRASLFSKKLDQLAAKVKNVSFATGTESPAETKRVDPADNVTKLEQKYVNFTDIISAYEALDHHGDFFRLVMLIVIVGNSIMIASQTNDIINERYSDVFLLIDYILLAIFIMEVVFKWFYGFLAFWKQPWNTFDVVIIVASLLAPFIRAFRSLRSITILNGLQIVVKTIFDSIPDMVNIILLLLILMFIWAVCGVTLFGSILPESFGDLQTTMFTLFIMTTQIGWVQSFDELEAHGQFVAAALYYSSFMVIGVFVFMKIIVAVVVSNLEDAYSAEKKRMKLKFRALKTSLISTQGHRHFQRPTRPSPTGDDPVWKNQIPFVIPDFEKISKAKVENYFLVLSIIEENLREYLQLKEKLHEILTELRVVNLADHEEEGEEGDGGAGGAKGWEPGRDSGIGAGLGGGASSGAAGASGAGEGDALSRWLKTKT